jgi:hypothetical protein
MVWLLKRFCWLTSYTQWRDSATIDGEEACFAPQCNVEVPHVGHSQHRSPIQRVRPNTIQSARRCNSTSYAGRTLDAHADDKVRS